MGPIELIVASGVLKSAPFGLVDVGASGGVDGRWRPFGDSLSALAFDPSITGCERLNKGEAHLPGDVRYIAQVVGGRTPPRPREGFSSYPFDRLHAHMVLREQSLTMDDYFNDLKPAKFVEGYRLARRGGKAPPPPDLSQRLRPRNTEWPKSDATLDDILRSRNFDADFIKIDTDGADFPILCGAQEALQNCPVTAVLIEANFAGELSPAANTFTNIDLFMRANGFSLFDLNGPWRYSRQDLPAPFLNPFPSQSATGQVLWSDALYLRDIAIPAYFDLFDVQIDVAKVCKLIAIAHAFDLPDFAMELVNRYRTAIAKHLDVDALAAALSPPPPPPQVIAVDPPPPKAPTLHTRNAVAAGFEFELLTGDPAIAQSILETKTYEPEVLALLKLFLRPGDTFVDVGANFGWHSLNAARIVGAAGRVLAFEPVPSIADVLKRNCQRNGFDIVDIREVAIGASDAQVLFAFNGENIGGGRVADFGTLPVQMLTLDQAIGDARPELIKIDVEGLELEALRGAQRTLEMQPVVVLEYNRSPLRKRIFRFLVDRGYTLYTVSPTLAFKRLRLPYVVPDFENIVAVPQRLADTVAPAASNYPHLRLWLRYAPPRMARQSANFALRLLRRLRRGRHLIG